jgi:hypothetical protein
MARTKPTRPPYSGWGRPTEIPDRVKLDVYLSAAERDMLATVAAADGLSLSAWVRRVVCTEAQPRARVLARQLAAIQRAAAKRQAAWRAKNSAGTPDAAGAAVATFDAQFASRRQS